MGTIKPALDHLIKENPMGQACRGGFLKYVFDFVVLFCDKTRRFRQNIVETEMKLRDYEIRSSLEFFIEM